MKSLPLVVAGMLFAVAFYGVVGGGDPGAACVALDHGEVLLEDYQLYYAPQSRGLAAATLDGQHLPGCYVTPSVACALLPVVALPAPLDARLWGAGIAAAVIVLLVVGMRFSGATRLRAGLTAAALLLSAPIGHAVAWGQTSAFATALVALATWCAMASRAAAAPLPTAGSRAGSRAAAWSGALWALAVLAKPWAVLAGPAVLRSRTALGAALITGLAGGLLLPVAVLGCAGSWDYVVALRADLAGAGEHFAVDPNSQHIVHVAARFLRVSAADRADLTSTLRPVTLLLAVGWALWAARLQTPLRPLIALLGVPLLVPTAWPHDLQVVPLLLLATLPRSWNRVAWWWCVVWLLQSSLLNWAVTPRWFGALGLPLLAAVGAAGLALGGVGTDQSGVPPRTQR